MNIAGIVLAFGLLAASSGTALAAPTAPLPFPVSAVARQTVAEERVFDGVVEAVQQSTVSAQVTGRIEEIHFDVDDYVPKGSVLVRFRSAEQRARVDEAQAALAEANARYREADAEYDRMRKVYERKLVAKAAVDQATAARRAASARLEAARAGIAQAQEQAEHTLVRAPYSGIVVKRHVEVGETANVGQALMTGLSLDALRAVVEVPQAYIESVRSRHQARVLTPGAEQGVAVTGLTFFPYADPQSHSFKVRVALPPGQKGLYPGMLVKVAFVTGEQGVLLVPTQAIVHRSELTGVYVVAPDSSVTLRQLRLGRARPEGGIEVLSGLEAGEVVALDPIRAGVYLKEPAAGPGP